MQVFDFDNTLYKGESGFDFAMYIIRRKPSLLKLLPRILKILKDYKSVSMTEDEFRERLSSLIDLTNLTKDTILNYLDDFWMKNRSKLYKNVLEKVSKKDVIVTASPTFMLEPIKYLLGTDRIIGTEFDLDARAINYLNFSHNKVKKFKEEYPHKSIKNLYTDSFNDAPLMQISKNVYLVKKNGKTEKIK